MTELKLEGLHEKEAAEEPGATLAMKRGDPGGDPGGAERGDPGGDPGGAQRGAQRGAPSGRLAVTLEDADLWRKFQEITNEMIVTKSGR